MSRITDIAGHRAEPTSTPITGELEDVRRTVADYPWPEERGNHRAVVHVSRPAAAVAVRIPWRRRDPEPETKGVLVVGAASGFRVENVLVININRAYGDIVFEPADGPGYYEIYYMPYTPKSGHVEYATEYLAPTNTADPSWAGPVLERAQEYMPVARVTEIQARRPCDSFAPMEICATGAEVSEVLAAFPDRRYLTFPEDRQHPIRMPADIPLRWVRSVQASPDSATRSFYGQVNRGEFFVWQIGVFAARQAVENVSVDVADMISATGGTIRKSQWHCFNLGGTDWLGSPFVVPVSVPMGKVAALWLGAEVAKSTPAGVYEGRVTIRADSLSSTEITLRLDVSDEPIDECGDAELWRHSRLRWLDSTIAQDEEVTAPYTPLEVTGRLIACLGRSVRIGDCGFPESIVSHFTDALDGVGESGREMLADAVTLTAVPRSQGPALVWRSTAFEMTRPGPGAVEWVAESEAGRLAMRCAGRMEYDGHIEFRVTLSARGVVEIGDIRLDLPIRKRAAEYLMGMGYEGGRRPLEWRWKWSPERHQDALWIGDVNAGLQCRLKGENYTRPLVNIYYGLRPLEMPPSWHNGGRGGCDVIETDSDRVIVRAYSGTRTLSPGEELHFDFDLLITPVKPLSADRFSQRYYHAYDPVEKVAETGASIVNIHHGNEINPFINYPFIRIAALADYARKAHERDMKIKVYYTVRELTNHVVELWALRSLGHEVFAAGPGMGDAWLTEHLGGDFMGAWRHPLEGDEVDAAILTSGMSRWHNYYLEGLDYLLRHAEIDGLYIDDVCYDRSVMKRARKVLDRGRPGSTIDVHSWNHFNDRAGYASCANLYMEHFPYVDRLWFGEGFDYNRPPEYWLVEISGIPFGLSSEMLQHPTNPWRGMVYGMTARLPWSGDPRPLWRVWDDFRIEESRMLGYWSASCPVRTDHTDVLATAYVREGRTLVALASWAEENLECVLSVDWASIGLDPSRAELVAPPSEGFQPEACFLPGESIPVAAGRGWLLILENN